MKTLISVAVVLLLLAGCDDDYQGVDIKSLPDELKDCKFYSVSDGYRRILVARCPGSSTSVFERRGKSTLESITVDTHG